MPRNEALPSTGRRTTRRTFLRSTMGAVLAIPHAADAAADSGAANGLPLVRRPVVPQQEEPRTSTRHQLQRPVPSAAQLTWQRWVQWGGPMAAGALPIATIAAVVVACTRAGRPARRLLAVLGLMFVSYVVVWLSSPLDTTWLVSMTFDRLLLQLWPSLVLAAFSYGTWNSEPGT